MAEQDATAPELFADDPRPRDTREKILYTAIDLFFTHGMHAVGLDMILAGVGVTKTTFYNHFESKEELLEAAIALRNDWEVTTFERALRAKAGYDPRALLLACFDVLDDWFSDERYRGCLFLMAINEYPHPSDPIHRAGAQHYLITREHIAGMARAAGVGDPEGFAMTWTGLLLGATGMQLVAPGGGSAQAAKRAAEAYLNRVLGEE